MKNDLLITHEIWDANIIPCLLGEFKNILFDGSKKTRIRIRVPMVMVGPHQVYWVRNNLNHWHKLVESVFHFGSVENTKVVPPKGHQNHNEDDPNPLLTAYKYYLPPFIEGNDYYTGHLEAEVVIPGGFKWLEQAESLAADMIANIKKNIVAYAVNRLKPPWKIAGIAKDSIFFWAFKIEWVELMKSFDDRKGLVDTLEEKLNKTLNSLGMELHLIEFEKPMKEKWSLGSSFYVIDHDADPHMCYLYIKTTRDLNPGFDHINKMIKELLKNLLKMEQLILSTSLSFE